MRIVDVADLPSLETTVLGPGRWHEVSQQQINQFADATGDHQWIHVDPEVSSDEGWLARHSICQVLH